MKTSLTKKHIDHLQARETLIQSKQFEIELLKSERTFVIKEIIKELGLDADKTYNLDLKEWTLELEEKKEDENGK